MKLKLKRAKSGYLLHVESAKLEEFLYSEAQSVKDGCDPTLLPFSYERAKKHCKFNYHAGASIPLKQALATPLAREYFEPLLISFLNLALVCETNGLSMQRVVFDEQFVFFDPAHYTLVFAYVPLRGAGTNSKSPLTALEYLVEHAMLLDQDLQVLAANVLDYSRRSPIFSWIEYKEFLQNQGVFFAENAKQKGSSLEAHDSFDQEDSRTTHGFDFMTSHCEEDNLTAPKGTVIEEPEKSENAWRVELSCMLDGTTWVLEEGDYSLGSSAENSICLSQHEAISHAHAYISLSSQECFVVDLDSTNGTFVDGCKLEPNKPVAVSLGQEFMLAQTPFVLRHSMDNE